MYVKGCGVNGLKLCYDGWDSRGFVKKDEDRGLVIQSCVYTEIHNILTQTSFDIDSRML